MKLKNRLNNIALTVGFCLVWIMPSAHAETWVRVVSNPGGDPSSIDIEADSIRKGDDGLVYFDAQDDMGISPSAVDCQQRIYYVVGNARPDWRSQKYPIKPGSNTAKEADFVCSRVS